MSVFRILISLHTVAEFKHNLHDQLEGLIDVDASQIVVCLYDAVAVSLGKTLQSFSLVSN